MGGREFFVSFVFLLNRRWDADLGLSLFAFPQFDRIASPSIRKRVALASASLCSTGDDEVLQRFAGEFVNLFIDVLAELKGEFSKTLSLASTQLEPRID